MYVCLVAFGFGFAFALCPGLKTAMRVDVIVGGAWCVVRAFNKRKERKNERYPWNDYIPYAYPYPYA